MKINIVSSVELTSFLEEYAERKFEALGKLVGHFEEKGEVQVWLELKEGKRHETGDIFTAAADMRLMKKACMPKARAPRCAPRSMRRVTCCVRRSRRTRGSFCRRGGNSNWVIK